MNSSRLLIDESPLQLLPSLAEKVGLNEAVVLQQVHYLITAGRTNPERDRKFDGWVYNTVAGWQEQYFKFWSTKTLQRAITSLEDKGLLISRQDRNYSNFYRMKWYTIDYKALNALIDEPETVAAEHDFTAPLPPQPKPCPPSDILSAPSDINNAPSDILSQSSDILSAPWDKLSRPSDKLSQSYTKITTEITAETTDREGVCADAPPAPDPEPPSETPKPKRRTKADEFVAFVVARGVDEATARDWWQYRAGKPMTESAWQRHCTQAEAAGISVQEAAAFAASKEWRAFYAEGYQREQSDLALARQVGQPLAPQGRTFDQTGREVSPAAGMPLAGGFGGATMPPQRTSKVAMGIAVLEEMKGKIRRGEI